ncbi:MAG: hypothetical protein ACI4RB_02275 [Acutalibacteraceae bacterium]
MKKDFSTVKNIILLIASALTLVAVTFAWYAVNERGALSILSNKVNGSTLSVVYNESDDGVTYNTLTSDLNMDNMYEGKTKYYRIDVKTFPDVPIKIIMSFDGLSASNTMLPYVYFDYKVVCNGNGEILANETGLKMSNYISNNVFAVDVSSLQVGGNNDYSVFYNVYVVTGGESVSGTASLGEVRLLGQQIS